MEELSTEEKAKRFDEVLAMAKDCITYIPDDAINQYMLDMFPELKEKESDDEKIRKVLISRFNESGELDGISYDNIRIWLEKQGKSSKQSMNTLEWTNEDTDTLKWICKIIFRAKQDKLITQEEQNFLGEWIDKWLNHSSKLESPEFKENSDEKIRKSIIEVVKQSSEVLDRQNQNKMLAWLERQGEQKSIDNVTQKIHIKKGKWYVCIKSFNLNCNTVVEKGRNYKSREDNVILGEDNRLFIDKHDGDASEYFRQWTIQDAKDGDVLVCESGERTLECLFIFKLIADREVHEYCSYRTIDKHFSLKDSFLGYVDNVYHPATEEQRDYLFQKINEAGYEWDADKKELKKVEQKPIWSEEDELNFKQAIYVCNQHYYFEVENWLKSLKDRIQQPE